MLEIEVEFRILGWCEEVDELAALHVDDGKSGSGACVEERGEAWDVADAGAGEGSIVGVDFEEVGSWWWGGKSEDVLLEV